MRMYGNSEHHCMLTVYISNYADRVTEAQAFSGLHHGPTHINSVICQSRQPVPRKQRSGRDARNQRSVNYP